MVRLLVLMLLCANTMPLFASRFLCNGMDAEGSIESDNCGPCLAENGPRWGSPLIDVHVDSKQLPRGLSKESWLLLVQKSFALWNKVPGTNLRLTYAGEATTRSFGSISEQHEIFWVTDSAEWRKKVGAGENGALGVTVSPYRCPLAEKRFREIYDADLIMNAVGEFPWRTSCESNHNCASVLGTLAHELGHFVGLGHPCKNCSWSLMSAVAGYDVETPLFDDMQGIRALYPGAKSSELAAPCNSDAECGENLACVEQEGARYCSKPCKSRLEDQCPEGMVCDGGHIPSMCKFVSGVLAGGAALGQTCGISPCLDGLVCTGADVDHLYCFAECQNQGQCAGREKCISLEQGGGACLRLAGFKEECNFKDLCEDGLICAMRDSTQGQCRKICDVVTAEGCETDEMCSRLKNGKGICLSRREEMGLGLLLVQPPKEKPLLGWSQCAARPLEGRNQSENIISMFCALLVVYMFNRLMREKS